MHITRKRKSPILSYFVINSKALDLVPHFKYLGVIISSNLSWSPHVDFISAKVRKLLGVLYRRFYAVSEPDSLLKIYKTQICPHLEYADFPPNVFTPKPHRGEPVHHPFLREPLAKSVAFQSSFVPCSIHLWNNLPLQALNSNSVIAFKCYVSPLFQ